MTAWYNENEPYAAAWLRGLITAGHLPSGDVDERDIRDVFPSDLTGYDQCHFFAGIGGWPLALRMAGWPDDRPVWTGSCPCQPFSTAGGRKGVADERHLWPAWFHLIDVWRPPVLLGEQVANAVKGGWLDLVLDDLEGAGYACRAAVVPACSVGAPHIRSRLWFVADAGCGNGREGWSAPGANQSGADFHDQRCGSREPVADAGFSRLPLSQREILFGQGRRPEGRAAAEFGGWSVEPGMGRVAHGVPGRVGRLRALGNAIVPQVAKEFILAYLETKVIETYF